MKIHGSDLQWVRKKKNAYVSENGKWEVTGTRREWYVYREDDLWGEWERDIYGKDYVPFTSLWEAVATIDEYEFRGFA